MNEIKEKELEFVVKSYDHKRFNPDKAISKFHASHRKAQLRRWWVTAAATAASVVIAVAAGLTIHYEVVAPAKDSQPAQTHILNPDVATTHEFVYDAAPLEEVLSELSAHYGCTLSTGAHDKVLTATFPDGDIDFIVSVIEKALDVDITVE